MRVGWACGDGVRRDAQRAEMNDVVSLLLAKGADINKRDRCAGGRRRVWRAAA